MKNLRTLSISEAVAATGIARDTLYMLCETGQLQANRPSPRGRWRIHEASLAAWVQHTTQPRAMTPAPTSSDDDDFLKKFPEMKGEDRIF